VRAPVRGDGRSACVYGDGLGVHQQRSDAVEDYTIHVVNDLEEAGGRLRRGGARAPAPGGGGGGVAQPGVRRDGRRAGLESGAYTRPLFGLS